MKSKKQSIPNISPEQTRELVELAKFQMGVHFSYMISEAKLNVPFLVRFIPVAKYCQHKRKELNLSIKEISSKIKVPQYQIKAIEEASVSEIQYALLKKYVEFLEIDNEFDTWAQQNTDIIKEIGGNRSA